MLDFPILPLEFRDELERRSHRSEIADGVEREICP